MTTFENIISEKYLSLTKKINEIINNNDYFIENNIDSNNEYTLDVYLTCNKKKIMSVKYRSMGFYNSDCEIFCWGDIIQPTNKVINELTRKIKKSKDKIKKLIVKEKYRDIGFLERLLYYLSNNACLIENQHILDLVKYCCYETNSMGILIQNKMTINKKYDVYYFVTDIENIS